MLRRLRSVVGPFSATSPEGIADFHRLRACDTNRQRGHEHLARPPFVFEELRHGVPAFRYALTLRTKVSAAASVRFPAAPADDDASVATRGDAGLV